VNAGASWDWGKFVGDPVELKWNRKDLENLQTVLASGHIKKRRSAVQAGGCLGIFPKYLATEFDVVYTFEPSPILFPQMVLNAPEQNIVRFQAALGHSRGMVDPVCSLRGNDGKTVLHAGMTRVESGGVIPTMRLDDLLLPRCDLIYLDIEGWELFALQGALRTISSCRPVIVCEINRGCEYVGITQDEVRDTIYTMGYNHAGTMRSDYMFVPREAGK